MPKDTFLNLKSEKKEKIEKAITDEFTKNSFEQVSISNIIQRAQIPRGSFYQYFEDKKDAVQYIIQKFIISEHEKVWELLQETNGDIFETAIGVYDYMTNASELELVKHILEELRKSNTNVFEADIKFDKKKNIVKAVNRDILKIEKEDDLIYFFRIITDIIRPIAIETMSKRIEPEKGKKILERELEILKRGMKK